MIPLYIQILSTLKVLYHRTEGSKKLRWEAQAALIAQGFRYMVALAPIYDGLRRQTAY